MADTKPKSNTPHDAPLGVTFGEVRSDEPHQPVTSKKLEMHEPLVKDTHPSTTHFGERPDEKGIFDVERAFHGDAGETGTVITDKRRASPTMGDSLKGVFHEWFGKASVEEPAPAITVEPVRLPRLNASQSQKEDIQDTPKSAAKTVSQPKVTPAHSSIRIEKIRTLRSDTERISNARHGANPEKTKTVKQPVSLHVPRSDRPSDVIPLDARSSSSPTSLPEAPPRDDTSVQPPNPTALEAEISKIHTHSKEILEGNGTWTSQVEPKKEKVQPMPQITERISVPTVAPNVDIPREEMSFIPESIIQKEIPIPDTKPKQPPIIIAPIVSIEERHVTPPPPVAPPPVPHKESVKVPELQPKPAIHEELIIPKPLERSHPVQEEIVLPKPSEIPPLLPSTPRIPDTTPEETLSSDTALDTRMQELKLAQSDIKTHTSASVWVRPVIIGVLGIIIMSGIGYALYHFVLSSPEQGETPSNPESVSVLYPQAFFTIAQIPHITTSMRTVLEATRTSNTNGAEVLQQIVPMYTEGTVTIPYTTKEFLTGLNAQLPSESIATLDDRFMLGYHTETQSPFLIFTVYNFDTLFVEMRQWEKAILEDLNPLFGDVTPLIGYDTVIHNKPARVLKDKEEKSVLFYVFLSNTLLVITEDESLIPILSEKLLKK